jgi:AraC-like DNA-binding protein
MFNYYEIPAAEGFGNFVKKFWVLDHSNSSLCSHEKYALPNGCFTLAFISGKGILLENEHTNTTIKPGVYFIGQISRRLKLTVLPYTKATMAQLQPWAPALITAFPMHELTNQFATLDIINKELYKAFASIDTTNDNALIDIFYRKLEDYLHYTYPYGLIQNVVRTLEANLTGTPLKIADIANKTGYTKRHVEKQFSQYAGHSPKELYNILRLRNVITGLYNQPGTSSLTQAALEAGYFDQSHFIKAYTGIMGSLPKKFAPDDYILPLHA